MTTAPGVTPARPLGPTARDDFVAMSVSLTGFSTVELQATGMVEAYLDTLVAVIGEDIVALMLARSRDGVVALLADPDTGPPARSLTKLWYLGQWDQLDPEWRARHGARPADTTRIVSADSFLEGLVWTAIGAHPPGGKQTGFGSWSLPPGPPAGVPVDVRRSAP